MFSDKHKLNISLPKAIAFLLLGGFFVIGGLYAGRAAEAPTLVINEFSVQGSEWVELANLSDSPVDLSGWTLVDKASTTKDLSGVIPAKGLLTFDYSSWLNNDGDYLMLKNGEQVVFAVSYGNVQLPGSVHSDSIPTSAESLALVADQSLGIAAPTKGWFNVGGGTPALADLDQEIEAEVAGLQTNLSELADPSRAANLTFELPNVGKIVFAAGLNLTDAQTVTALGALAGKLEISAGKLRFDVASIANLKEADATITMYGLTYDSQPNLLVQDDTGNRLTDLSFLSDFQYVDDAGRCGASPICKQLSFKTGHFTSFEVDNNVYVDAAAATEGNGSYQAPFKTLPAAVAAARAGQTIKLAAGTYTLSATLTIDKALTLQGVGDATIVDATATAGGWGLHLNHSDISLKNFKILAPQSADGKGGYAVHAASSHSPMQILSNITLDGLVVENGQRTPFDVNAVNDVVLKNLVAKNSTRGNGLQLSGVLGANLTNISTENNAWGGIAIYVSKSGQGNRGSDNITIDGASLSVAENNGIYIQDEGGLVNGQVTVSGYDFVVKNGAQVGYQFIKQTFEQASAYALSFADGGNYSTIKQLSTGDYLVKPGLNIRQALRAVEAGHQVKVYPGDYNIDRDNVTMISGQAGWYLPIEKSDVSLVGVDANGAAINAADAVQARLYSVVESANGSWSSQNLITVFGDNVSLRGLAIMNKISPNKGVEVLGNNFVVEHCQFLPVPKELFPAADNYDGGDDITKYGSGVYFNNNGATSARTGTVRHNRFVNSGITFDSFRDNWTMEISANTFDGNKLWRSGGQDYYYSAIGATTWANQPDFSGSLINIKNNRFINMLIGQPILKIKTGMTGNFDARDNWWGTNDAAVIGGMVSGTINYRPWLASSDATADATKPAITISPSLSASNSPTATITITLSEEVSGFTESDLQLTNASLTEFAGTGQVYTAKLQPSNQGLVRITVASDSFADLSGNQNLSYNWQYTYDSLAPSFPAWGDGSEDFQLAPGASISAVFSEHLRDESARIILDALDQAADNHQLGMGYSHGDTRLTITNSGAVPAIFPNDVYALVTDDAGNQANVLLIDSRLEDNQLSQADNVSLTPAKNELVLNQNQPVQINVPADVTGAKLNADGLIEDISLSGSLPAIAVSALTSVGQVDLNFAQGTVVTGAAGWDGVINLPTIKANSSVAVVPEAGKAASVQSVIEVGFDDTKLTFNKAVRLKIAGAAGRYLGYSRGGVFTPITTNCAADTQAAGDALPAEGDCRIDVGGDLIIWTKHFTKFVTYTQTVQSSGGGGAIISTPTVSACAQVEYGDWGACVNGQQLRTVKSQSPNACTLTDVQLAGLKQACQAALKPTDSKPAGKPGQVLGVKTYADGSLLKDSKGRIYLVQSGKLLHLKTLKQLAAYRGKAIIKVSDQVIKGFAAAEVKGLKLYPDGSLLKDKRGRIFVVAKGIRYHIAKLADLRLYAGRPIIKVSDQELGQYKLPTAK